MHPRTRKVHANGIKGLHCTVPIIFVKHVVGLELKSFSSNLKNDKYFFRLLLSVFRYFRHFSVCEIPTLASLSVFINIAISVIFSVIVPH